MLHHLEKSGGPKSENRHPFPGGKGAVKTGRGLAEAVVSHQRAIRRAPKERLPRLFRTLAKSVREGQARRNVAGEAERGATLPIRTRGLVEHFPTNLVPLRRQLLKRTKKTKWTTSRIGTCLPGPS
jgi:hypothetical protein